MKRLFGFLFPTLIASFLFVSCNNEISPTDVNDDTPYALQKPDNGAEIFRYSTETWFSIIDWDAGLRVHLGIKDMNICIGDLDLFDFKDKLLPNNDPETWDRIMTLIKGKDVMAYVRAWPPDYDVYPSNCDYYAAVPPIASGPVNVMYKDNDIDGWARDANANVWSLKAHGKLIGQDGQVYNLNAMYKAVFKGYYEPPDYITLNLEFLKESSEIKLH